MDKIKLKDIKFGDCFAYQIKDDPDLKGRYFIMCLRNVKNEEKVNLTDCNFLLKITDSNILPKNEEEINSLENVLVDTFEKEIHYGAMTKEEVLEKKSIDIYPDEYGYLYMYTFYTYLTRKKYLKDLIYLGNFNIEYPHDEYIMHNLINIPLFSMGRFEEHAVKDYKGNNLRQYQFWHLSDEKRKAKSDYWLSINSAIDKIISAREDEK